MSDIKQVFNSLYSGMQRSYESFSKVYRDKKYFLTADMEPIGNFGIPYYNSYNDAFSKVNPAGMLPQLTRYHYRQLPVSFGTTDRLNQFMALALFGGKKTGTLPFMMELMVNGRKAVVNYDQAIMKVGITVYSEENFIAKVVPVIDAQNQLALNLIKLQNTYNDVQKVKASYGSKTPKEFYAIEGQLEAYIKLYQTDPDLLVKVAKKESPNNALPTIGDIGLVPLIIVIIGAIALTAVVAKAVIDVKRIHEREKARAGELDRIKAAFDMRYKVLTDTKLTEAQKAQMIETVDANIQDAQGNIDKIQKQSEGDKNKGFFERLESLLFIGGAVLILNNVTRKSS